ncbi:MAG: 4-hydroxythreonine-4-phosphate dehydrogenase PdxA [Paludibacteraceae bacterium]|nr:4-hydroxythreonine-4-phosphate dehydrogenase PdxA [Paludibacteraceae bacterium]
MKPTIAITAGDINGVGYEIILKSLANPHICEICRPIVYGNAKVARQHMQTLDEEYRNIQWNIIQDPKQAKDGRLNLISCYGDETPLQLGVSTTKAGQASLKSLQRACQDLKNGLVHAIVTAPINKDNIQSDAFRYSGHTEYLTQQFGEGKDSLMMMISDRMRVALVCNHTPIAKVAATITEERILSKLAVLNETLQKDFSCRKPRIAVLALNPHAGDNGLIGEEETNIIRPAVAKAQEQGIWAFGPYSADGFFGAGQYNHFDAVLAMYHDQGLAPFKALDMSGVNFTAGLPVVRTSPDHGTAYSLAGKNEADATSMLHAIYAAIDILREREENEKLLSNQLVVEVKEVKKEYKVEKFIPQD